MERAKSKVTYGKRADYVSPAKKAADAVDLIKRRNQTEFLRLTAEKAALASRGGRNDPTATSKPVSLKTLESYGNQDSTPELDRLRKKPFSYLKKPK